MPLFDVSGDERLLDGTQAATFTSVNPAGNVVQAVADALAFDYGHREALASGGAFAAGDRGWRLPLAGMAGLAPKEGDTVTGADGVVWVVYGEGITLEAEGLAPAAGAGLAWSVVCYRSRKGQPL